MKDLFNYAYRKAAKNHICEQCGGSIPKGEIHIQGNGMWEGEWQNLRMHKECFAIGDNRPHKAIYGAQKAKKKLNI